MYPPFVPEQQQPHVLRLPPPPPGASNAPPLCPVGGRVVFQHLDVLPKIAPIKDRPLHFQMPSVPPQPLLVSLLRLSGGWRCPQGAPRGNKRALAGAQGRCMKEGSQSKTPPKRAVFKSKKKLWHPVQETPHQPAPDAPWAPPAVALLCPLLCTREASVPPVM